MVHYKHLKEWIVYTQMNGDIDMIANQLNSYCTPNLLSAFPAGYHQTCLEEKYRSMLLKPIKETEISE